MKANEKTLNDAHAGVGSVSFTTCLLLNSIIGVKPTAVPFNGTGPSMNALVGGQVDYMCDQIVNAVPQIKGGTIKAYAIATRGAQSRRCPTCRPPRKPACRRSRPRPGTRCSPRRARRRRWSTSSPTRSSKALDDEGVRKRLLDLGSDIPDGPTAAAPPRSPRW